MKMVNLNPDNDVWEIGFGDYCSNKKNRFVDSGLAALDAHKEELYEAAKEFIDKLNSSGIGVFTTVRAKFESILNQIEKEK